VKPTPRPTIRQIAEICGFSRSAVSLALRNDPSIPEETRNKIKATANRLGYYPDPLMSAFASRRWKTDASTYRGTLAWLDNSPTLEWHRLNVMNSKVLQAARERAQEFGYQMDVFWLREPGKSSARLSRTLINRGIQGVLLAPQAKSKARLHLQWNHFSVVSFGYTLVSPRFHTVAGNQYSSISTIMRRLRALGYRRVGFAMEPYFDARMNHQWEAGFLWHQNLFALKNRIPPLVREFSQANFEKWIHEFHPQVVVTHDPELIMSWLQKLQLRVPEDVGVTATMFRSREGFSGMKSRVMLGRIGIDLLIAMLQRNEKGIPEIPQQVLIEPVWTQGKWIRRLTHAP
jgi:LacI family transcriptional regulator